MTLSWKFILLILPLRSVNNWDVAWHAVVVDNNSVFSDVVHCLVLVETD